MHAKWMVIAVLILSSSASLPAFAQDANCSDGEWFCSTREMESVETEAVEQAPPVVVVIVEPKAHVTPPPPDRTVCTAQPRPVVRQTPRTRPVVKSKTPDGWKPTAGFEFRAQRFGFLIDPAASHVRQEASMVGGGAGLRLPYGRNLEVDVQNDVLFGTDFNGLRRSELGFSLHLVRHINPEDRLRFYWIGGAFVALGNVISDSQSRLTPKEKDGQYFASYGALSGQIGAGAELRIAPWLSFRTDAQLALRWRFAATQDAPEYWDYRSDSGVNTYPGFLLRAGVTIW